MKSLWQNNTEFKKFNRLYSDLKTDVLIIGGGIAGILCSYELDKAGVDYALVEQGRICEGVTPNTTAKITAQHGLIYNKLEKEFSLDFAKKYLIANQSAINRYRELSLKFECDFEEKPNYVYSVNDYKKLEKELYTLNKMDYIAEFVNNIPLPLSNAGAIKFDRQAQFNPLKLLSQLSENLNIYENTKVYDIDGNTALANGGRITADNIIVVTHFPFINRHGSYFLKMYQHRSYVIALDNGEQLDGMYVDEAEGGLSFRNYGKYLMLGGCGVRTGGNCGGWKELEQFATLHYPESEICYQWATQDCMTLDGIPYIGKYSRLTNNLFVATGFNKWGMTSSMVASKILTDLVLGKENDYKDIFSPSRTMMRPQLAVNSFEAVKNLCSFSPKRCSHLGCALKWNREEHTWDCPCHGSRFDKEGNILDNPAVKPIKDN